MQKTNNLQVIGSTEYLDVAGFKNVPAKIDTGADSSSIWASNIKMKEDGTLAFSLFDRESPFFTKKCIKTTDYAVKIVRSSNGDEEVRYRVKLPITLKGETFETTFTLSNRSRNSFPVLIGRRTLKGKFLVNVSKASVKRPKKLRTPRLNKELKHNPYQFHQKYINEKGEL